MTGFVVDIGNARIKWAEVVGGELRARGDALHVESPARAFDALDSALPERLERLLVANVAGPQLGVRLAALARQRFGLAPEFVKTTPELLGVRCGYEDPSRLGVDRWISLVAAHRLVAGAVCVVSAGTAVTFDAVDAGGQHLGGLILAGPRLAADALAEATHDIGRTAPPGPPPDELGVLGRSTDAAVGHGAMLAIAAALDRAHRTVARALGAPPPLLIAGGDGAAIVPWLETKAELRADLVLEGLAMIMSSTTPGTP